jgi:branched-chain amino acid transport system substrate-binding protein
MKFLYWAAGSVLCALLLPTYAQGNVDGVSKTEIRIGMVNAQTGPSAGLGQSVRKGVESVFSDVNQRGGIHGRRLVLSVADDGYDPPQTIVETLRLVQDDAVFSFIGFVGTPTTNAILPIIKEMALPVVGVVSGSQSLREPVIREVFNIRASYAQETEALIAKLFENGAKSVAVVYQFDGFGLSVLAGTKQALQKRGAEVVATGYFQRNTTAIRSAVGAMLESQPDVIVFAGTYEPAAAFMKAARASGLKSQFATVSFVGITNLLPLAGEAIDGLLVSQVMPFPYNDTLQITRDCRRLLSKYDQATLTFIELEGCISAQVLVNALESVGGSPTRPALINALEKMRDVDLGGLRVGFSASNHQAMTNVYLTQVRKGLIVNLP